MTGSQQLSFALLVVSIWLISYQINFSAIPDQLTVTRPYSRRVDWLCAAEGFLPTYTRIISVNRQYPDNRLTGRNLKSVPLRVTDRVSAPARIQPKLEIGPAHGPPVT